MNKKGYKKKQVYVTPYANIVVVLPRTSVAIDMDDEGDFEQMPGSFGGEQMAKPTDGDFEDFDGDADAGVWDIPEFTTPQSWEE